MIKALLIATALAVAAAKDTYVVLTPKSFRPGIPLSVSIKILQSASTVHVTGDLVNKGNNQKVATATETFHQGTPGYLQIQVPDDLTSGSYKLQVHGLSSDLQFTNETDITYEGKSISIFIQTDKAMYKPGETVNFRAFAMFPNVSVYHGTYDVDIYDANTNKIKQWKGLTDASGVITNYLNMDSQPVLGDWKIKVYAHGRSTEKVFTVAHYVLPKFEVTVELPSYSLTSDSQITAKIIAKYTYGKPVKGTVSIKATIENWYRPYNYHGEEPAVTILDHAIDGEASLTIPLDHIKQINKYMNGRKILVEANVTESLNHITLSGNSNVQFYSHAVKLEFLKSNPKTFKPALPYTAYLKVSQQDDLPVAGIRKEVNITTSVTYEEKSVDPTPYPWYQPRQHSYNLSPQTFTVPDSGIVPIQVDIPANSTHISVSAHYGSVTTQLSLSKSYSPSDSYMQLFLKSTSLKAGQLAAFDIKGTEQVSNGVYQVMSRGSVVGIGSVSGDSFTIPITSKMAPNARVIVYYVRADGEVVTDSISFDVEGTFSNQVSLDFDKTKAQPGDSVNMVVNADPNSMAYLLAVDQSVLLLKSGNDITASQVVDELKSYDTIASTNMPIDFMGGGGMLIGRKKRMIWWPYPVYYGGSDAHQIFDNAGVKVITDASVYHHVEQHICYDCMFFGGGGFGGGGRHPMPAMATNSASSGPAPLAAVDRVTTVCFLTVDQVLVVLVSAVHFLCLQWLCMARPLDQHLLRPLTELEPYSQRHGCGAIPRLDMPMFEHHGFLMGGFGPVAAMTGAVAPGAPQPNTATGPPQALKVPARVRKDFSETWLWSNATIGSDGRATISTTVPDTITSWVASAFAVNQISGLGVSPVSAKIEGFKPFFVSLNLPYSVVRGEQLALQADVFNYMTQDLDVVVTLEQSNDFRNIIVDSTGNTQYVSQQQTESVHVLAGQAKAVFFPIVPAILGTMSLTVKAQSVLAADAVQRQLLVEPEGVGKEFSNPILIDLKDTSTFSTSVPLSLPVGVVAGSQRATVTAIGDLMGPTVNGLDKLLRMPTGCGEQTMLGFAPDIFVTDYLTATHQLTGQIEEKAIGYMEKGYQRELTFQHKDGSFSAFGDRDKSGSMWLTAFVTKSFHQAKDQIFIDDDTIKRAIDWMVSRQNSDGTFPEPGRVIHKDMQGGSASGLGLTAFVLISLLENNDLGGSIQQRINKAVTLAQTYLESQISIVSDDYALAISSYALQLAKSSSADVAFTKLNSHAIVKDGLKHWHKVETSTTSNHHWRPSHTQANPIDIEMSSYALMVYAQKSDFSGGMSIMKWLTSQRNSNGGFASTQDTVMGLQALSDFARMAYADSFDIQATITAGTYTHTFSINKHNALILQSVILPSIPSQVTVSATGHGIALLDVSLAFHVEQEIEEPSFDIIVTMEKETMDVLTIKTCASWLKTGASGMAVQEFGIPTGFEADLESLAQFTEIKKVETDVRKVILYFDEISTTPLCITMDAVRTGLVAKSQPAAVRLFDYYQPSNQVTKFYQSKVLQNADICDVCAECGCASAKRR